jgi:hypothetical protein
MMDADTASEDGPANANFVCCPLGWIWDVYMAACPYT